MPDAAGPDAAGPDAAGPDAAGEVIAAAVRDRGDGSGHGADGVPGVVAAAGRGAQKLATWVAGRADTTPGAVRPMRADTVFDLASLTKVVATTTVALALAGAGQIGLDDPAARYLRGARGNPAWKATIRQLLAHASGLPASVKFFQCCADRDELLRELFAMPPEAPPGTRVAYSDLGFMALGEIIATVAGAPLDVVFRRLLSEPLGMRDAGFNPVHGEFAATERRPDGTSWTGVVHDENARLMSGVAGHAGLFSTVADLGRFAAWWVSSDDGPVPAPLRREAESCQTCGLSGRRGLGWALTGDRHDILGGTWPASAVSHTGFTGTSLALDAASGAWAVLLTNAVHFGRDATAVRQLRRDFHSAVATMLFA